MRNIGGKSKHNLPTYHSASSHLQPHECFERSGFRRFSPAKFDEWTLSCVMLLHSENFWGEVSQCVVLCCVETPAEPAKKPLLPPVDLFVYSLFSHRDSLQPFSLTSTIHNFLPRAKVAPFVPLRPPLFFGLITPTISATATPPAF
jgi:hypothetical protein